MPTILVGPALGAAVVYGIEQGDLMAARHVVREKAEFVRHEFDTVVRDLSSELHAQSNEFARQLERSHVRLGLGFLGGVIATSHKVMRAHACLTRRPAFNPPASYLFATHSSLNATHIFIKRCATVLHIQALVPPSSTPPILGCS